MSITPIGELPAAKDANRRKSPPLLCGNRNSVTNPSPASPRTTTLRARLVDEAGIEMILVGDSLAQTMLGYENTLSVTMDEMLHHVKAVRRGVKTCAAAGGHALRVLSG